jgi:hypothetical protein
MVYTAYQQLKIFGDRHYLDNLHYSPYLWGRLAGSYGIHPLSVIPADYPMPTLFVGAPSNGYTDELVEQDWQDVQDFLSPQWWVEPEGFITDAATDAITLIKTYVQEKWKLEPHIRIVFCGVVSDSGNVWEFADGSVVPFSQFSNAVEGRATPVVLDVISATPNASDWSEKIKAFNAKNAPTKVINLYVPDAAAAADETAASVASAASVAPAAESVAASAEAVAEEAPAEEEAAAPAASTATESVKSAAPASVAAEEEPEASSAAEDAAAAAAAAEKFAAKAEAAQESVEEVAAGAEAAQDKLENDVLVEKAKMNDLWSNIRTRLKQRGEDKKIRAEKYELLRKNKYWYDWPYTRYYNWESLPYHPTYQNYYYPWHQRPGTFKNLTPFADHPGWLTK